MTDQTGIQWPICGEHGCIGVGLGAPARCIAHARDEDRNATLRQLGETGEIDARGVPITQTLLEQILAAAPRDAEDHPKFKTARFDWATFQGKAVFDGAIFQGKAVFRVATFQVDAGFRGRSSGAGPCSAQRPSRVTPGSGGRPSRATLNSAR